MQRAIVLLVVLLLLISTTAQATVLKDYVNAQRALFQYDLEVELTLDNGVRVAFMRVFSGEWKQSYWIHRLRVLIPPQATGEAIAIYVAGSSSGTDELRLMSQLALQSGQVIAILYDTPLQPLFHGLTEDALVSYTFGKYLETEDLEWPSLFPMVRAVIATMDALEGFGKARFGQQPKRFLVSGGSKRGWTTWLAAAVDDRIVAIMPAVYDNLNLEAQMKHQLIAWGDYSYKIDDYTNRGIPQMLDSVKGRELARLVDPYAYREHITVPKLILVGTNDPYWPVDAANLYISDLHGPTYIHNVPNAGHSLNESPGLIATMATFIRGSLAREFEFPDIQWQVKEQNGRVTLAVETTQPAMIRFWMSTNTTRDFRKVQWQPVGSAQGVSSAEHVFNRRPKYYAAIYAEAIFQTEQGLFSICSPVHVIAP